MSAADINRNLFIASLNRLRIQLFGTDSLKIYEMSPLLGESLVAELLLNWSGRRVVSTTDGAAESGFWQFQIETLADWNVSQVFMLKIVALVVGTRRFKVKKVEKPIGTSRVWKVKAEIQ